MSLSQLKQQVRNIHLGIPVGESINSHEALAIKSVEKKKDPVDWTPPTEFSNPKEMEMGIPELLSSFTKPKNEVDYTTERSMDNLREFIAETGNMLARHHMDM